MAIFIDRPLINHPWSIKQTGGILLLALACFGIETGILFAYGQGWKVGLLSAVLSPLICFSLLLVSILAFGEKASWTTLLGIMLSVAGVTLIHLGTLRT